jgi:hypothetical protein
MPDCVADEAVRGEPVSAVCQPVDTLAAVAIALDCYNRGRPHTKRKRSIAPFQNDSLTKQAIPLFSIANRKETMQKVLTQRLGLSREQNGR